MANSPKLYEVHSFSSDNRHLLNIGVFKNAV